MEDVLCKDSLVSNMTESEGQEPTTEETVQCRLHLEGRLLSRVPQTGIIFCLRKSEFRQRYSFPEITSWKDLFGGLILVLFEAQRGSCPFSSLTQGFSS